MAVDQLEHTQPGAPWSRDEIETGGEGRRMEILNRSLHEMGSPLSAMRVLLELMRVTGSCRNDREKLTGMLDSQVTEMAERLEALVKEFAPTDLDGLISTRDPEALKAGNFNSPGDGSATTLPGEPDPRALQGAH